jgi:ribosomal protein S18 acetylase RimI-like enzyme
VPVTVRPATVADAPALAYLEMGHPSARAEREWREKIEGYARGRAGDRLHVLMAEERAAGSAPDASLVPASLLASLGDVVGYLCFGQVPLWQYRNPPSLEVLGLHVLSAHRRRGVGTALVAEAARQAHAAGAERLLARCIASNTPARCFYDALQAEIVDQGMFVDGGLVVEEVVYGWDDLPALMARVPSSA